MCRLLGFAATTATDIPEISGAGFGEFVELSKVHKDSWGLALDAQSGPELRKSPEVAATSEEFHRAMAERGIGGLLHFRWASPGLAITKENAHPFSRDGISFIHNGAIQPYEALASSIPPELLDLREGTGDSELFFLFTLNKIRKLGMRAGVLEGIRTLRRDFSYSSINSMFLNEEFLIVISEHHPDNRPPWSTPDYYELRYQLSDTGCVVASSGWDQNGWQLIPNHSALIVDRRTISAELINL